MNNKLDYIPEISFVPCNLQQTVDNMIHNYETEYERITGVKKVVQPAEAERVLLQSTAYIIHQVYLKLDYAAKMNFLKYAEGAYLENLGAMMMVTRLQPSAAITKVRFRLSAVVDEMVIIKKGTRIASGNGIMFATNNECYIPPGQTSVDTIVVCTQAGLIGNGIPPGKIQLLVDPINYVTSAENLEVSQGGADLEDDENLRMRIYMKPDSFSVAGPVDAYRYFAFSYSQNVSDCRVINPSPGTVKLVVMLKDSVLPTDTFLTEMKDSLQQHRPLTDALVITKPTEAKYNIQLLYYLGNSLMSQAATINTKVAIAAQDYINWQKECIGRDINQNELVKRLLDVGVKRVEITAPTYSKLTAEQVAVAETVSVTFGGFEND